MEFAWPWGDALATLDEIAPDLRLVNVETSITHDGEFAPGKAVHGHERYRDDLRMLYFASLEADTGRLAGLRMAVMQARRLRLRHAARADREWLGGVLDRVSRPLGARIRDDQDGMLSYQPF